MIGRPELQRRSAALGISVAHVELDYVLNHLLVEIARDPGDLVFRGGTALARVYWPDFRISEDLDFIGAGPMPDLENRLARAVGTVAEDSGLDLVLAAGGWREDQLRARVHWTTPWSTGGELLLDVVRFQRAVLPVVTRPLHLPYTDLGAPRAAGIPVQDLNEIMANKWLMLEARREPRDLFDLWWALRQQGVAFSEIAGAHMAVYGYPPMRASVDEAARLETGWEQRLRYQRKDLPPFGDVLSAIRTEFESWRSMS